MFANDAGDSRGLFFWKQTILFHHQTGIFFYTKFFIFKIANILQKRFNIIKILHPKLFICSWLSGGGSRIFLYCYGGGGGGQHIVS